MNTSYNNGREVPAFKSHLKLGREDSYVRKQTTIFANKIILEMPESTFFEDDRIIGNIILDLKSKINAKRLTLQIIGELNYIIREPVDLSRFSSTKNISLNEVMDSYQKSTSLATMRRNKTIAAKQNYSYSKLSTFRNGAHSFTSDKRPLKISLNQIATDSQLIPKPQNATAHQNAARAISSVSRSQTYRKNQSVVRSITRSNTKIHPISRQATQATTEIFCHYLIPIFQFKSRCHPGKYKFPFNFQFNQLYAPTTDFSRDNFKLHIKYTLIAEVEEDPEDDSILEEDEDSPLSVGVPEKKMSLKCVTTFEVFWNYKKHLNENNFYSDEEYSKVWKFMVSKFFCSCFKKVVNADIVIGKTILTVGDLLPFTIKLYGPLSLKEVDLRIDLFEEVSNVLIEFHDTSTITLVSSFKKELIDDAIVISGDIDLGAKLTSHSLRSNDWNISHILEFNIITNAMIGKNEEKFKIPCLIVPSMWKQKEIKQIGGGIIKPLEDVDDDEPLTMVYCKFKLEDRFDIIKNHNVASREDLEMD